jgi:CRP-like cAMP-binding protein
LCLSFHPVEARLSSWLLEARDRRSGVVDVMPMTQEFLSNMLGVQRTTVNAFAGQLQKGGLIEYNRVKLRTLDVEGLEVRACECRTAVRESRERLGLKIDALG